MKWLITILLLIVAPAFGSGFLASWQIPTEYENGDPLPIEQIGGYLLKYRPSAATAWIKVVIPDPNTYQYRVDNLEPGTYSVTVSVFDLEGTFSNDALPVSVTIPAERFKPKQMIIIAESFSPSYPLPEEIIKLCETEMDCTVVLTLSPTQ